MSATQREVSQPRLGELVGSLAKDVQALVWGEIKLARAELDQKLHRVIIAAIWLVGGALLAFAGLVVILESIAAALALVLPSWAALLIVGIAIVAIGGLFARSGLGMLALKALTPDRTVASLQKDVRLVKEHT
ncbi:MAG: phage holin family protein [Pseudomonadota bacterium]|nr:phage holin family protein [Pseudomonadota bacterium]